VCSCASRPCRAASDRLVSRGLGVSQVEFPLFHPRVLPSHRLCLGLPHGLQPCRLDGALDFQPHPLGHGLVGLALHALGERLRRFGPPLGLAEFELLGALREVEDEPPLGLGGLEGGHLGRELFLRREQGRLRPRQSHA